MRAAIAGDGGGEDCQSPCRRPVADLKGSGARGSGCLGLSFEFGKMVVLEVK